MNEMDGLGPQAEVIFLLTTNRPEVLEPALSARPGRIDQAIEFPLPDDGCRRRLFELYGRGLDLSGLDLDAVGRPDGRGQPGVHRGAVAQGGADGGGARRGGRAAAADRRRRAGGGAGAGRTSAAS